MESNTTMTSESAEQRIRELVGGNIVLARELAEISQNRLAGMLGVHRRQLSAWERGRILPRAQRLEQIAAVLEQAFGWFYVEHDVEPRDG